MSISDDIGQLSRADNTADEVLSVLREIPMTLKSCRKGLGDVHHKVSAVEEGASSITLGIYRQEVMTAIEMLSVATEAVTKAIEHIHIGRQEGSKYIDKLQS